jgi:uncharacterized membrane protein YGL010W
MVRLGVKHLQVFYVRLAVSVGLKYSGLVTLTGVDPSKYDREQLLQARDQ